MPRHFGGVTVDLGYAWTLWRGRTDLEPAHELRRGFELIWDKFGYVGED